MYGCTDCSGPNDKMNHRCLGELWESDAWKATGQQSEALLPEPRFIFQLLKCLNRCTFPFIKKCKGSIFHKKYVYPENEGLIF